VLFSPAPAGVASAQGGRLTKRATLAPSIVTSKASVALGLLVMMILSGLCALITFFISETHSPTILKVKVSACTARCLCPHAHRLVTHRLTTRHGKSASRAPKVDASMFAEIETRSMSLQEYLDRTVYRPFKMLLTEPILFLITMYLAFVYASSSPVRSLPACFTPPPPFPHVHLTTPCAALRNHRSVEVYPRSLSADVG